MVLLFNPIIPVYLQDKGVWAVIDIAAAILLVLRYFTLRNRMKNWLITMATVKKSFISNLIGRDFYDGIKEYAKPIILIGTGILAILFLLSLFVHWTFISRLLNLVTGTSLLFIIYIAALIFVLDKEVDIEEPDYYYRYESERTPKTKAYKMTIVWGIVLIIMGISAIYFSNRYRKQYAFDCSTFLVDQEAGIYHLDWINGCKIAAESEDLVEMKGYEIKGMGYKICEGCKEYAEEVEDAYNADRYYRR